MNPPPEISYMGEDLWKLEYRDSKFVQVSADTARLDLIRYFMEDLPLTLDLEDYIHLALTAPAAHSIAEDYMSPIVQIGY